MGVDRKIPRRRSREDKGPRPLCGADRRRGLGKTSGVLASPERGGWATACPANEFQGIRPERLPPPATQEMEGLNGPDNNRTNSNTFAKSLRELRTDGSQSGSTTEIPRSKGAVAIAKCGQPPQVGFERNLQNGGRGRDHRGQPSRLARHPERSENADQTRHDQGTGSARIVCLGSEGEGDFSAGCPGRNATRRDSRSAMGES